MEERERTWKEVVMGGVRKLLRLEGGCCGWKNEVMDGIKGLCMKGRERVERKWL